MFPEKIGTKTLKHFILSHFLPCFRLMFVVSHPNDMKNDKPLTLYVRYRKLLRFVAENVSFENVLIWLAILHLDF